MPALAAELQNIYALTFASNAGSRRAHLSRGRSVSGGVDENITYLLRR